MKIFSVRFRLSAVVGWCACWRRRVALSARVGSLLCHCADWCGRLSLSLPRRCRIQIESNQMLYSAPRCKRPIAQPVQSEAAAAIGVCCCWLADSIGRMTSQSVGQRGTLDNRYIDRYLCVCIQYVIKPNKAGVLEYQSSPFSPVYDSFDTGSSLTDFRWDLVFDKFRCARVISVLVRRLKTVYLPRTDLNGHQLW